MLLLAGTVVLLPAGAARQIPTFLLLWIVPAIGWSYLLRAPRIEGLLMGGGLAMLLNAIGTLLLSYLPGPVSYDGLVLLVAGLSLLPLALRLRLEARQGFALPPQLSGWRIGILVLAATLALRLPDFTYKELQGDEGIVMVRAAATLAGDDEELFLHQKGPAEILIPIVSWGLTGALNDAWARAPFAWAGTLGVMALAVLARRWFGEEAGIVAGMLFAINGFGIAFSRIAQYQSLVILWGTLAVLAASRFRGTGRRQELWLAAVFLAGGLLAHYDAILFAPAVIWLVASGLQSRGSLNARSTLTAVGLVSLVAGLFYAPWIAGPSFGQTIDYLLGERVGATGGGLPLTWSGLDSWRMLTFYNSTWYVLGIGALAVAGGWHLARRRDGVAAILLAVTPILFYLILIAVPRTHVYTFFPGTVVLAGVGWTAIAGRLKRSERSRSRKLAGAGALLWMVVAAGYVYLLFIDVTPERQRNWDQDRPWPQLYWTTWKEPPKFGLFGFPHQSGWRLAADLVAPGQLPYGSNEEKEITTWYMAQAPRTHCANFGSFLLAENVQDGAPYEPAWLQGMSLQERITVNGIETMRLYSRTPEAGTEPVEAGDADLWLGWERVAHRPSGAQFIADTTFDGRVRLTGYDLDTNEAYPGGEITVTLYWEALTYLDRNYQVFAHLYDGTMWGQHDGAPECAVNPTTRWEPGQLIADPHVVPIDPEAPEGQIPLLVGVYDLLTLERLDAPGTADNALQLTSIELGKS